MLNIFIVNIFTVFFSIFQTTLAYEINSDDQMPNIGSTTGVGQQNPAPIMYEFRELNVPAQPNYIYNGHSQCYPSKKYFFFFH